MSRTGASDTLATIQADSAALDALLLEVDGEVTPETEAAVTQWFAELDERRAAKVDGYGFRIKAEQADAAKWKALGDELYAKSRAASNRAEQLMRRMEWHLTETAQDAITGDIYTFKFQANGGKAPLLLESDNPEDYPEDCRRVTVSLDKDAIRSHVEAGDELPAHIGERGRSLRLR